MLRTSTTRPFLKGLAKFASTRSSYSVATKNANVASHLRSLNIKRPRIVSGTPFRPVTTSLLRFATNSGPLYNKVEAKAGSAIEEYEEKDVDMFKGIRGDLETIKETFALTDVPNNAYYLGAAGLIPYVVTSLSTVYLAYDINYEHLTGSNLYISSETAHQLLGILEPIQIGYGAVIISFLGAIHWGLELAKYGGEQGYSRYAIGVVAPAIAWPTMLMPIEYALISQFLAFNFLYFADTRATSRGWCPPWYGTYRFVLTFVVGTCIVASLVGRGQIAASEHRTHAPVDFGHTDELKWQILEKEERERLATMAKEEEEGGEGEEKSEDSEEE